jgi:hypothetical protein
MSTGFKLGPLGGTLTDVRTQAFNLTTTTGWDGSARKKGRNVDVKYNDGELSDPRKWYGPRIIPLRFIIFDTNAAGGTDHPGGPEGHLRENMDALNGLLYARDSLLELEMTVPGTRAQSGAPTQRAAVVEHLDTIDFEEDFTTLRTGVILLRNVEGFWREKPQATQTEAGVTTASHGFNIVTGGNRPVRPTNVAGSFEIEWTANAALANPRYELDTEENFVQYGGNLALNDVLLIDVGKRTGVLNPAGAATRVDSGLTFGHAWWIDLDPNTTTAVTTTVTLASDYDVETRWYNRWA